VQPFAEFTLIILADGSVVEVFAVENGTAEFELPRSMLLDGAIQIHCCPSRGE
jgi:hypothetical protein